MTSPTTPLGRHRARRRLVPVAWVASAAAAALLGLTVSGTLANWTTAIVNNDTNTATSTNAVILQETGPGSTPTVCNSTDGAQTTVNSYTCSSINKYGGGTLVPGTPQSTSVTMKNTGNQAGALTLGAGACSATGGLTGSSSLCGVLQVKVECPSGSATYPATGTATLNAFATATGTTPSSVGSLAAGASVTCTFAVSIPSNTSPMYAGQTVRQGLTWTLTAS